MSATDPRRRFAAPSAAAFVAACSLFLVACWYSPPEPMGQLGAVRLSEPTAICVGTRHHDCRAVPDVRRALEDDQLTIVQAAPTPGGAQGAAVVTLRTSDGLLFDAKWRSVHETTRYSQPVAELAADQIQRMILAPRDTVVPPAAAHCFDQAPYERELVHYQDPEPETHCVLGFLSLWLSDAVRLGEARATGLVPSEPGSDPGLFEPRRFQSDPVYRRNLAHVNLIAFLIANGDAHAGQFVVYRHPAHVFLVDNSIAFGLDNESVMESRQDLSELYVPAIPEDTARRILELRREDIDQLMVLTEMRAVNQQLKLAQGRGEAINDPDEQIRRKGSRVQIGLTHQQVVDVWRRVQQLQRYLRSGRLGTFPATGASADRAD